MKIVMLDAATLGNDVDLTTLESLGQLTKYDYTSPDQTISRIGDAQVVLTNKVVINDKVAEACKALEYVGVLATGTNNIQSLPDHITVKNAVGYSSQSVAQLTLATLMHLWHRLPEHDRLVKSGRYHDLGAFTHLDMPFSELSGKQVGILGMGNIGQLVAQQLSGLGMKVVYHSLSGNNTDQPYEHLSFEELLSTSDVVSIHSPLNEHTTDLINEQAIDKMQPGAILINMGRGGIVNESALAEGLAAGKIKGAAIDVFEKEPVDRDNPLLSPAIADKLVLTPHIAWASQQARQRLVNITVKNLQDYLTTNR